MNTVEYRLELLNSLAQQPETAAMIHDIGDNGDDLEVWATFPANPEYDVITFASKYAHHYKSPRAYCGVCQTFAASPAEQALAIAPTEHRRPLGAQARYGTPPHISKIGA